MEINLWEIYLLDTDFRKACDLNKKAKWRVQQQNGNYRKKIE